MPEYTKSFPAVKLQKTHPSTTQAFTVAYHYMNKPTSSRRVKPTDLFANGTARSVFSFGSKCLTPCTRWYQYDLWTRGTQFDYSALPIGTSIVPTYPLSSASRDACDTKTLLKIKNQKVNLSVSIPEFGKTTSMVTDFFKATWGFLHNAKRGRIRKAIQAIRNPRSKYDRDLASKWLAFQYGWIPTALEVHGLSEFIYEKVKFGYITGSVVSGDNISSQSSFSTSKRNWNYRVIRKNNYRYRVDSHALKDMSSLGITNPAAAVYELMPYSFVVDWFLSIGDYLSAMDALVGITDLRVIKGYSIKGTVVVDYDSFSADNTLTWGQTIYVFRRTERLAPVTSLKPMFPKYNPSLGMKRMINSAALLRNLFK